MISASLNRRSEKMIPKRKLSRPPAPVESIAFARKGGGLTVGMVAQFQL
jgi:hypothetical protein